MPTRHPVLSILRELAPILSSTIGCVAALFGAFNADWPLPIRGACVVAAIACVLLPVVRMRGWESPPDQAPRSNRP